MSNFFKLIIERIEYENLIEEGKDPVEVLHYKFQHIPEKVIDKVIEIDPTKKKSYSQWLLSHWDDEKDTIISNLKNGRIEKLFQHYKEHNDIQIKDCPSVKEGLENFVPEEDTVLEKSTKPTTILRNRGWEEEVPSELANDFDIVFNEDNWIIAVPNTYEADCKLGENMNWCTAGGRSDFRGGRSYFDRYLSDYGGKYYVNFDMTQGESRLGKDYPFTRYQFHFESHQFMDKEDDPVEIADIGMPESAKEYYLNEGYDEDSFIDEEGRMERYETQRFQTSYRINDELILNIAYDADYNFEEPDESTDFYVFSEDDDRDPISWDEIPNPHVNDDVIILNQENFCILKKKYGNEGGVIVAANNGAKNGWNNWFADSFLKHLVLPNNSGVFGLNSRWHNFEYISALGKKIDLSLKTKYCEYIFFNEYCSKYDNGRTGMIFVEAVDEEYHSLFGIDEKNEECKIIVAKDIPENGKYFFINENGMIEGEVRSYRIYDDNYYGGVDNGPQYNLDSKLTNGDYLISMDENDNTKYNILKPQNKQILFKTWFDEYIGQSNHLYSFEKEGVIGFFKVEDGQQVGKWYNTYGGLDPSNEIIIGIIGSKKYPTAVDIINGAEGVVTATFKDIISTKPSYNKIIVQSEDGNNSGVFDYIEGRFYFPELSGFRRVCKYGNQFIFTCYISNTDEMALFDLSSLKVKSRGIKNINNIDMYDDDFFKIEKMDGKFNVFDTKNSTEILPADVDTIASMNKYMHIIVYELNGKSYPYDYRNNRVVINPNGLAVPTDVNNGEYIRCSGKEYNIYFSRDKNGDFKLYKWQNKSKYNDYGTNFDPQNTPQEVMNMYNLIYGQQESIMREFNQYLSRINEAMKLRLNDMVK